MISFLKKYPKETGMVKGAKEDKGNNFLYKHWKEIIGYLEIDLFSNVIIDFNHKQEKRKLFLAINKKTRKSFVKYYLYKSREIFLFKNIIDEKIISRALSIALKRVSYNYYFREAKNMAFDFMVEGLLDKKIISDSIYDLMGPELSEEDRTYAIEYARQKFNSAKKHKRL